MIVTRVFAFRACTNAARNAAPSGPVTLPVIVAPKAIEERKPTALTKLRILTILSGFIIPPCQERLTPLGSRTRASSRRRGRTARENRLHQINTSLNRCWTPLPQRLSKRWSKCLRRSDCLRALRRLSGFGRVLAGPGRDWIFCLFAIQSKDNQLIDFINLVESSFGGAIASAFPGWVIS